MDHITISPQMFCIKRSLSATAPASDKQWQVAKVHFNGSNPNIYYCYHTIFLKKSICLRTALFCLLLSHKTRT